MNKFSDHAIQLPELMGLSVEFSPNVFVKFSFLSLDVFVNGSMSIDTPGIQFLMKTYNDLFDVNSIHSIIKTIYRIGNGIQLAVE